MFLLKNWYCKCCCFPIMGSLDNIYFWLFFLMCCSGFFFLVNCYGCCFLLCVFLWVFKASLTLGREVVALWVKGLFGPSHKCRVSSLGGKREKERSMVSMCHNLFYTWGDKGRICEKNYMCILKPCQGMTLFFWNLKPCEGMILGDLLASPLGFDTPSLYLLGP